MATAIGAGIGALVGGLVGVVGTLRATRQTITSSKTVQSNTLATTQRLQQQTIQAQMELAAKQRQHEREEAREARIQERFENTYIDVIDYLGRVEQHVRLISLRLRPLNAEDTPLEVSQDAWFRLNARLYAYGTDRVRDGVLEVQKALTGFAIAYATLQDEKDQRGEISSLVEARSGLESHRDEVLSLVATVRTSAIDDLRRLRSEPA